MKTLEITDILTPEGIEKLEKGKILIFDKDGQRAELKITKVDKKNQRVWAQKVVTYRTDEIVISTGRKRETISEYIGGKNARRSM